MSGAMSHRFTRTTDSASLSWKAVTLTIIVLAVMAAPFVAMRLSTEFK
jgi:hypothetical protein